MATRVGNAGGPSYTDGGSSVTATFGADVTAGNLAILVVVQYISPDRAMVASDVTKSAGTATIGTVTLDAQSVVDAGSSLFLRVGIFSAPITGSGSLTLQCANAGASSYLGACVDEWSGVDTSASRVADSDSGSGSSTTPATGSATSGGGGVFIGGMQSQEGGTASITPDTGYSTIAENEDGSTHVTFNASHQIVASNTTDTAGWTIGNSQYWSAAVAVYKDAGGGGGAFPSVAGTPVESSTNTAGTSHTVNLPSGITSGETLLVFIDKGSTAATFNALTGWTELVDENLGNGITILWRKADGTEGASITLTSSASTRSACIAYRVSGAADPTVTPPTLGTVGTGTSVSPDPGNCNPGTAKDYLWFTLFGGAGEEANDDTWANSPPSGFGSMLQKACGTVGTNLGGKLAVATQQLNAASLDAGTWSQDVSTAWRAYTVAVHPAPSGPTYTLDLTESVTASEVISRAGQRALSESTTLTEALARQLSRALAETVTSSDTATIARIYLRTLSETLGLSDTRTHLVGRTLSETVTATEALAKIATLLRGLAETVTLTEARTLATSRALAESVSLTDTVQASAVLQKVLSESVALSEALSRAVGLVRSDAVTLSDTRSHAAARTLSETATLTDSATRAAQRALVEAVSLADTITNLKLLVRTLTDGITLSDTRAFMTGRVLAESVTLTDLARGIALGRAMLEAVTLQDAPSKALTRTLADTLALVDSVVAGILTNAFAAFSRTSTRCLMPSTETACRLPMARAAASGSIQTAAASLMDAVAVRPRNLPTEARLVA